MVAVHGVRASIKTCAEGETERGTVDDMYHATGVRRALGGEEAFAG